MSSMSITKIIKQIRIDLEEFLLNTTDINFDDDRSNYSFLEYRTSLFKIIFFSIMKKKVRLLKSNLLVDPDIIKNTLVLFNNTVNEINSNLADLQFDSFNLELTKPEHISIAVKKNPFRNIIKILKTPSLLTLKEKSQEYKPLSGLITFIIYHKTKTKTELSINVISNTLTAKQENQLKDITDIIDNKNPFVLRELEAVITYDLKTKLKKNYLSLLTNDKSFEETESDLYYGFLGTITLNKNGIEDINDVLDMLYYSDKVYMPYIKLYYSIYQYKKETKHYIYTSIDDISLNNYKNIFKADKFIFDKQDIQKYFNYPLLFFFEKDGIPSLELKVYKKYTAIVNHRQNLLNNLNDQQQVTIILETKETEKEKKIKCKSFFNAKDILYNNICCNKEIIFYNKNKLFPGYILYDKKIISNNYIFNQIRDNYIMANNEILWFKEDKSKNDGIYLLFKINPTHIPWGKIIAFLKNNKKYKAQKFNEPIDVFNLLQDFKKEDPVTSKIIIDMLLYRSLSLTFNDIYQNNEDEQNSNTITLQSFQTFYEKHYFVNNDCVLEKVKTSNQENLYKDFLFIFKIILLFINNS